MCSNKCKPYKTHGLFHYLLHMFTYTEELALTELVNSIVDAYVRHIPHTIAIREQYVDIVRVSKHCSQLFS